ncbi:cytochrome-b5 reductase [Malassezia caprae]|uniref:Cytochrome-b5 reductase n=1 Tax=Malassezia caprae TaxID=1381934 RepID=A0AAF0E813_9BASI|nr:cytochrome-b5 reductase [Malassezia caprae]
MVWWWGGSSASDTAKPSDAPTTDTKDPATPPIIVDDDTPPLFPAPDSAQRQPERRTQAMAPPRQIPSGISSLRAPPQQAPLRHLDVPVARKKVVLEPGCSPLDWARLKQSTDLRGGVSTLLRVTPSELQKHNTMEDAWTAIQGKVYNITPYIRFHPGGQDTLMRVAGRDGTRLFCTYTQLT